MFKKILFSITLLFSLNAHAYLTCADAGKSCDYCGSGTSGTGTLETTSSTLQAAGAAACTCKKNSGVTCPRRTTAPATVKKN